MDEKLTSLTRYSAADRQSGSPRLTLTFEAKPELDPVYTDSYSLTFKITRDSDDPQKEPCIIHWDPVEDGFSQSGIIILHHESNEELRPIQVEPSQLPAKQFHPRDVPASDPCFKQLTPGDTVSWEMALPSVYFDSFIEDHLYEIFWPGGQISLWDWGTLVEHNDQLVPKFPAMVLPGGQHQSLEIINIESDIEDDIASGPSPRPLSPSARVSDAPVFSVSVAGPARLSMKDRNVSGGLCYPVTVTVTYNAAPDPLEEKPVIFHTFIFKDIDNRNNGFRLYVGGKDGWRPHELNGLLTHHLYRFCFPDPFHVGHSQDRFRTLRPGESCSLTREVSDFPKNAAPGDVFRYGYKGGKLDWWDWGNFGDHEDTVVWIYGGVTDPKDNEGRPGIMIPASNLIEFTIVE
ncbi:hypothetical protein N7455_008413 [Penicillium solitum]|uniref:uncharacterized protein n=1 Tax=Penicillium solitum TaxID=60172 RepID=UPI0032C3FCBF|nr:hypothetical protein N7455_008413 [Penicillium solitum]